jgi:hypothetical protein
MKRVRVSKSFRSEFPRSDTVALIAARGTKTPPDYLAQLVGHKNYKVRDAAVKNKCTPKTVTQYLLAHPDIEMRNLAAHSPHATADQLETLRKEVTSTSWLHRYHALAGIARNKNVSPDTLRALSQERYPWYTTVEIAKNAKTPVDVLIEMSFRRCELIKSTIARHPKLPIYRLKELLTDKKAIVRRNALKNPNVQVDQIRLGLGDARQTVRESAQRLLSKRRNSHK